MQPLYPYSVDYTWTKTLVDAQAKYDFSTQEGIKEYYEAVVGKELVLLRNFLKTNSFIGYLLAPKNAGKGTYMKGLRLALGGDYYTHVSVGDVVREAHTEYEKDGKESDVYKFAAKNYRGYIHIEEAFEALVNRSLSSLVPTEFILTLIKRVIDRSERKTVFIDGFPRNLDQISYSLYFRELINYRNDPDVFILINTPFTAINERIKSRVICPECKSPRNLVSDPSRDVRYDEATKEFYFVCDNPNCKNPSRMVRKEGDDDGIMQLKDRILMDIELMNRARKLYGIPKIELYNAIEHSRIKDMVTNSEVSDMYKYEVDANGKVAKIPSPMIIEENDVAYVSLEQFPVIAQLIKQLVEIFNLS